MKILFTISVLLNVVALGIGAGAAVKALTHKPWKSIGSELTPEGRDALKAHFKASRAELEPTMTRAKALKKELLDIMQAQEFDAEQFEGKAAELSEIVGRLEAHKITSMGALAQTLSYEDRVAMSEKFKRFLLERPRHRKPHGERGERADKGAERDNFRNRGARNHIGEKEPRPE